MEIRFKSSIFDDEVIKIFQKNFERSTLKEDEIRKSDDFFKGGVREILLNNAFVLHQDYSYANSKPATLQVVQDSPIFLLHFELNGGVSCKFKESGNPVFNLEKDTFNLFYIPASERVYRYASEKRLGLKIHISEAYLQSKMGYCFIHKSKDFQEARKNNLAYAFFGEGINISIQLKQLIKEFLECSYKGTIKQSFLEAKLTELLLVSLTNSSKEENTEEVNSEEKASLTEVENYIQNHLQKELTISDLSLIAGFNTSKFKKSFKEVYGTTVFKYITACRIEKAKKLIAEQDYTIAQASYEVGYKNPQHFTVAFKKLLGYLPSQLKKYGCQILYVAYFNEFDVVFMF